MTRSLSREKETTCKQIKKKNWKAEIRKGVNKLRTKTTGSNTSTKRLCDYSFGNCVLIWSQHVAAVWLSDMEEARQAGP